MNLFVLDNSYFVYRVIKNALEDTDINVIGYASTGREGIEQINILKPDLISLDYNLKDMPGFTIAKEIAIDVIMCSTFFHTVDMLTELPNVKGVILKPFHPRDYISLLNDLRRSKEIMQSRMKVMYK